MKKHYTVSTIFLLILIPSLYFLHKSIQINTVKSEIEFYPVSSTEGNTDNPFAASEFRYNMLASAKDSKNSGVDLQELRREAIKFTKENLTPESDNSGIGWVSIGPGNIGGRIRSIIIHPVTTSVMLLGAVAGGVWKTTNGGTNWVEKLDTENPISIGSMVRDITDPNIVYAGSGEGWGNGDAVYGGGIYKSTDFGDTWTLLPSTIGASVTSFRNVKKMAIDPSGNVYAATRNFNVKHGVGSSTTAGGLFKSTNGGTTWTKISSA